MWSPDLGFATPDPVVREVTERAVRQFEELECHVEETSPDLERPDAIWWAFWTSGNAAVHMDDFERVRDQIDPGRIALVEEGRALSGPDLARQQLLRNDYYLGMQRFMQPYDPLLTPTLARTAFPVGRNGPSDIAGKPMNNLGDWTPFCAPFNLTGQPAATVPCGFDRTGLPIGLQIVGRWHDDATVLRAAAAFEAVAPWAQHRPKVDEWEPASGTTTS